MAGLFVWLGLLTWLVVEVDIEHTKLHNNTQAQLNALDARVAQLERETHEPTESDY